MRNISIDRQDKSRSGTGIPQVVIDQVIQRKGRLTMTQVLPAQITGQPPAACTHCFVLPQSRKWWQCWWREQRWWQWLRWAPTLWGRMWGWEGSEVRGRGYFISPHNSPTPCTSSSNTLVVVEHLQGLELHWQGRSPCRRKHRVRDFWRGRHPVFLLPGCSYHRISALYVPDPGSQELEHIEPLARLCQASQRSVTWPKYIADCGPWVPITPRWHHNKPFISLPPKTNIFVLILLVSCLEAKLNWRQKGGEFI